jgi:hypothetical protein
VSRRRALALAAGGSAAIEFLRAASASSGLAAEAAGGGANQIILIRHGEKPVGSGPPFGIDSDGNQDGESLTVQGWERAGALVELFAPASGKLRPGITRPTALFASNPGATGSKRPLETITPLAQRLGVTVNTPVKDSQTSAIAKLLRATSGTPLAAWQHQDIPSIAHHIGQVLPKPPKKWPGHRFDVVWVFTRRHDGTWNFTQVPQLLLAGDKHSVIE